jgi:hypothetical protein
MDCDKNFLVRTMDIALGRFAVYTTPFRALWPKKPIRARQPKTRGRSLSPMIFVTIISTLHEPAPVAAQDVTAKAPMGWSLSPVADGPCDLNENLFREIFHKIQRSGLDGVGFRTIVIENCWQASSPWETSLSARDVTGSVAVSTASSTSQHFNGASVLALHNTSRFPRGLKSLSQELRTKGFQLGVQVKLPSCFGTSKPPQSDFTPGLNPRTAHGSPRGADLENGEREPVDEASFVRALYEQGFEFVRIKSCLNSPKHRLNQYHALGIAFKTAFQELSKNDPQFKPITVSLHDPEVLGVEAWSMDPASLWSFDTKPAADFMGIFDQASRANRFSALSGKGHWNEPGPLWPTQLGWTFEQKKTQWQLWVIMGSPLLIPFADDHLGRDTVRLVANPALLSIYHDHIGLQALPLRQTLQDEVWIKPLSRPGHRAILLVNKTERPQMVGVDLSFLGLEKPFIVREVMSQRILDLAPNQTYFEQEMPSFGSILVSVVGQEQKPLSPNLGEDDNDNDERALGQKERPSFVSLTQKIPVYGAGLKSRSKPQKVAGIGYTQVLSVDAPSVVRYFLGGQCQKFQSLVGIEDGNPPEAWMGFEVWADGVRVFASKQLSLKNPVRSLEIKMDSVNYLDLVTLGGATQPHLPTGQWIYPSLRCEGTPPNFRDEKT